MELKGRVAILGQYGEDLRPEDWYDSVMAARKGLRGLPNGTYHIVSFHYANVVVEKRTIEETSVDVGQQLFSRERKERRTADQTE